MGGNEPCGSIAWVLASSFRSRLLELPLVLVRFDHVAHFIVNANRSATGIFGSKVKLLYFV
jgi:hypothetical protein